MEKTYTVRLNGLCGDNAERNHILINESQLWLLEFLEQVGWYAEDGYTVRKDEGVIDLTE